MHLKRKIESLIFILFVIQLITLWKPNQGSIEKTPLSAVSYSYNTIYSIGSDGWSISDKNHGVYCPNGLISVTGNYAVSIQVQGDCDWNSGKNKAPYMAYVFNSGGNFAAFPTGTYSVTVQTTTTATRLMYGMLIAGSYNYLFGVNEQTGKVRIDRFDESSYTSNYNSFETAYSGNEIKLWLTKTSSSTFRVGIQSGTGSIAWCTTISGSATFFGLFVKGWGDLLGNNCPSATINFGEFKRYSAPSAPVLSIEQLTTKVNLAWTVADTGNSPITGFSVWRGTSATSLSKIADITDPNAQSYSDTPPIGGVTYYYAIAVSNGYGTTDSNEVSILYKSNPTCPLNPSIVQECDHHLTLAWNIPSSNGGDPIQRYIIERGISTTNLNVLGYSSTLTYHDDTTVAGTTYYYQIKAENSKGQSPASTMVSGLARDNPAPIEATNIPATGTTLLLGSYSSLYWNIKDESITPSGASYYFKYALNGGAWVTAFSGSAWTGAQTNMAITNIIYGTATRIQLQLYVNDGQGQVITRNYDLTIQNEIPEIRYGTLVPQGELNGVEKQIVYISDPSWNAGSSSVSLKYRSETGSWITYQTIPNSEPLTNFEIPYSLFNTAIGNYKLQISAQDGFGASNALELDVQIVNSIPVISSLQLLAFENNVQTYTPHINALFYAYAVVTDPTPGEIPTVTFDFCQMDASNNWVSLGTPITITTPQDGVYSCWLDDAVPNFELKHFMEIRVRCYAADALSNSLIASSNLFLIQNTMPAIVNKSVQFISNTTENRIQALVDIKDVDGDDCVYQYRWYKQTSYDAESLISGAITKEITNVFVKHGDIVRFEVRVGNKFADTYYWGTWNSSNLFVVPNSLPIISKVELPANITAQANITPTIIASDLEDAIALEYKWTINGIVAYTGSTLPKTLFKHGDVIQLSVRANDYYEPAKKTEWVDTESITVKNTAPILTYLDLNPETVYFDDIINITAAAKDYDGDAVQFWYEFYVNGELVQAGTNQTLEPSMFKGGQTVYCIVYAFDSYDPHDLSAPLQTTEIVVDIKSRYDEVGIDIFMRMSPTAWMVFGGSFGIVFISGLIRRKTEQMEAI